MDVVEDKKIKNKKEKKIRTKEEQKKKRSR